MRYKKPKKVTSLVITDRDGMPVYNADTFRDAIRQTRDYMKWLLEELPPDYELRIRGLLDAMYPLEWLTEDAVIKTVTNKP